MSGEEREEQEEGVGEGSQGGDQRIEVTRGTNQEEVEAEEGEEVITAMAEMGGEEVTITIRLRTIRTPSYWEEVIQTTTTSTSTSNRCLSIPTQVMQRRLIQQALEEGRCIGLGINGCLCETMIPFHDRPCRVYQ